MAATIGAAAGASAQTPQPIQSGALQATQPTELISVRGFSVPIPGKWISDGSAVSGVPLGGLGTGFLELRPDGRIHDAVLHNNWLNRRPPARFRIVATIGSGTAAREVVLLSTEGDRLTPSPCRYFGHFPFVDLDYGPIPGLSGTITMRAFSPFLPGDSDLSNIPAALFTISVSSKAGSHPPIVVRVSLQVDGSDPDPLAQDAAPTPIRFKSALSSGYSATTTDGNGYAVASSGAGWSLSEPGKGASNNSLNAVGQVKPGQELRLQASVAWYSPAWRSSDGVSVMNRYATRFADARGVAAFALDQSASIEKRVIAWQQSIYEKTIPDWLKDALINSLYALARNSVWLADGRLLINESFTGRAVTEPIACRFYASHAMLQLFPQEEKQTVRAIAKLQAANGEIPFGLGAPDGIESPMFGAQRPIVSSEFVLLCFRDFLATDDLEFLVGLFPRIKRALQFAMTLDSDNDGLINEAPGSETGFPSNQYYDHWPWFGTSAYTAGIGLAALRAGEEAARKCGDEEFAAWCRERFDKGRAAYDEMLWAGRWYRLYSDPEGFRQSDTCLANQLCGQTAAWLSGLGDILPEDHIRTAVKSILSLNAHSTDRGAVSGQLSDGRVDESGGDQARGVIPTEVITFASVALYVAARRDDDDLRQQAIGVVRRLWLNLVDSGREWEQPFIIDPRDGCPISGRHYSGNLCWWMLPAALANVPVLLEPARTSRTPERNSP